MKLLGTIKWYNDKLGYGFITPQDGGPDIYLHATGLLSKSNGSPQPGDLVEYAESAGARGPKADKCQILTRSSAP